MDERQVADLLAYQTTADAQHSSHITSIGGLVLMLLTFSSLGGLVRRKPTAQS